MNERDSSKLITQEIATVVSPENGNRRVAQRDEPGQAAPDETVAMLRLLWESQRFLGRVTAIGLVISTAIAFLIPNRYQSVARLMPPDNQSTLRWRWLPPHFPAGWEESREWPATSWGCGAAATCWWAC